MAEYIKREDVLKAVTYVGTAEPTDIVPLTLLTAQKNIRRIPAADVVEVVRCKDCAVPHNKWLGCPNLNGKIPPPDFYCARGERKEQT